MGRKKAMYGIIKTLLINKLNITPNIKNTLHVVVIRFQASRSVINANTPKINEC